MYRNLQWVNPLRERWKGHRNFLGGAEHGSERGLLHSSTLAAADRYAGLEARPKIKSKNVS